MSVTVKFSCNGCNAVAEGTKPLRREFVSFSGRSYGWGTHRMTVGVEDVLPEGWVAFDPCTQCCYCPTCWAGIVGEDNGAEGARVEVSK